MNAVMPVSEDPPIIMVAIKLQAGLLSSIRDSGRFGVNVLGHEQSDVAISFAIKPSAERFDNVEWSLDASVPRLAGASAFVACQAAQFIQAGDRVIVLGNVQQVDVAEQAPLTFYRGSFGTHVANSDVSQQSAP